MKQGCGFVNSFWIRYSLSIFAPKMSFTDKFDKDDFYLTPEGYVVFTEKYHLKRGYCCQSDCRHCPYKKQRAEDGRRKAEDGGRK